MINNLIKARLAAGETVAGCFLRHAAPDLAEYLALLGWDFLIFDGEHGSVNSVEVANLSRAVELHGVTPIARVPTNLPHHILRFLDAGAHGVHVPWVNTPEGVEQAVQSVKYHPRGLRGLAGNRSGDYALSLPMDEIVELSNRETLTVIHIETLAAVEAIEEFVQVDGVDVLFLGSTDLSQSMGLVGQKNHPDLIQAMERVASVVTASDKTLGIFVGSLDDAEKWIGHGARYIATGMEGFMKAAMMDFVSSVHRM
jgi:4-hydroxy-2-oxoheptanedioate aldolase